MTAPATDADTLEATARRLMAERAGTALTWETRVVRDELRLAVDRALDAYLAKKSE